MVREVVKEVVKEVVELYNFKLVEVSRIRQNSVEFSRII